ncbi:hypothetical protein ACFLQW_01560 [Candidatus Zixiibacteriota bacterium]
MMKRFGTVIWVLILLLIAGCSKAPVDEEKRALDALDLARQAEADIYAAQDFAMAQDTVDAAIKERERQDERFKLFRSYENARQKFLRAESLAGQAAELARGAKSQQVYECRDRVQRAAEAVDSCATLLDSAPKKGKGSDADLRMLREDLVTMATELGAASDYLDNLQYAECMLKADSVLIKADMVREQITEALAKLQKPAEQ